MPTSDWLKRATSSHDSSPRAGWTEKEARNGNVNDIAEGRGDHGTR
jgi:hypothetical protein